MSDKNTNESLLKTWAESQQKLLTDWLDALRRLGGTPTVEQMSAVELPSASCRLQAFVA